MRYDKDMDLILFSDEVNMIVWRPLKKIDRGNKGYIK